MILLANYWNYFRDELKARLEAVENSCLIKAWKTEGERTAFYTSLILPQIANKFGLEIKTELFKVDCALCARSTSGHLIPLIFVESENKAWSASHEMHKLCSLSAPLKVLISCVEWCEEPGYWRSGGARTKLLEEWKAIIRAHNEVWPSPCFYGIIIGELKRKREGNLFRFYKVGIGANGNELDPESVLVERFIA
jgi:hypothetical protein